jgi:hypothetical protein
VNAHSFSNPRAARARRSSSTIATPTRLPRAGVDRERSHFGDVRAQRRELGAADDPAPRPRRRTGSA